MLYENSPLIETPRLILRKFTQEDVADLFLLLRDERVNTFLPWFPLQSEEDAAAFLAERFLQYDNRPSSYRYAICQKQDNRPIGYVWLSDSESCDFGYGLRQEYWHQGIVTEAAGAALKRIQAAGYPYITATHDVNNPHSGAVMKKLGMTYRYSYIEQWQPKDIPVTFRMYQRNFDGSEEKTYLHYWNTFEHFVERDPGK